MNLIRKIINSHSEKDEEFIMAMKKILGFRPKKLIFIKKPLHIVHLKK